MQTMQTVIPRFPQRQRGGLILGLILGIVMGLGIAFFVSSYISNKVPVPQINKAQTRSSTQDEAEAEKNKNWDPNSPLYGKNGVKPASGAEAAASAASGATSPAPKQQSTAANDSAIKIPNATPIPKPDVTQIEHSKAAPADPMGDLIKSKSKSAAAPTEPFSYYVQVGAFRTQEDAESQRAKLALTGVETKITEREQSGRAVYRVRMGPYNTKEEAEHMKDKMSSTGIETSLVRVQR